MTDQTHNSTNQELISEDLKELVIARLDATIPPDKKISIGSEGEHFAKKDLINHVRLGDEIGKKIVDLELKFLRAMKGGELLQEILSRSSNA